MNLEELQAAITATLAEIEQVKDRLEKTADVTEVRQLLRRKKELQYLQLWHLEQLEFYNNLWG